MPLYRFYCLPTDGRVAILVDAVDCVDDDDALAKAKERSATYGIEIWDLGRRVALVEPQK